MKNRVWGHSKTSAGKVNTSLGEDSSIRYGAETEAESQSNRYSVAPGYFQSVQFVFSDAIFRGWNKFDMSSSQHSGDKRCSKNGLMIAGIFGFVVVQTPKSGKGAKDRTMATNFGRDHEN